MKMDDMTAGFRQRRRALVKEYGKRAFRRLDRYMAGQSLVPNQPVFDASLFPWTADLEAGWKEMRGELDQILRHRERLPRFQDISPDQMRISPDDKWRTFVFYGFGYPSVHNCALCPETAKALARIPGLETALFSILAPGKRVPSHHGVSKGLIRCHLGLIVPKERDRCVMDVGDVTCSWEEGRALVFDDTYPHAVRNDTSEERAVLLLDFRRPMTWRGHAVREVIYWLFRRTAFVKDAIRNEREWEERYTLADA
jgi:beta-hydroxylase